MKIRNGFVSNSSSSSFILVFDELPKSVEELRDMLNFDDCSTEFSPEEYARQVFHDIQEDFDDEDLKGLFRELAYWHEREAFEKVYGTKGEERDRLYKIANDLVDKLTDKMFEEFKEKNKGKHIRIVSYSDNDGDFWCELEHGNLFANIEQIYINQH